MAGRLSWIWHEVFLGLAFAGLTMMSVVGETCASSDTSPVQLQVDTTYPTLTGAIIQVAAGEDLQAALDVAQPGDIIELEPGASYFGPFVLPRKPSAAAQGSDWILVRTAGSDGALPPAGMRIDPSHADHMATLEAASDPILSAAPGAHHFRFEGLRIRPTSSGGSKVSKLAYWAKSVATGVDVGNSMSSEAPFLYNLVSLGTNGDNIADLPHHIIFDRCYIHGDPVAGARRGIALNSRHTAVINSYLADFKEVGVDSQAILGWNGPGPFKIVNNFIEAAGENIMFGSAVPRIQGLVPADIEIRGNHFSKPLGWKIDDAAYEGTPWTVKNLLELKNAERVLIEGNILEYAWPHAQNGFAVLFTVRNQHGDVPWATVRDVTFRSNLVRHVGGGINILGLDDNGHPSRTSERLLIDNNLFQSVGGSWGGGTLFQLLQDTGHVVISHNTADQTGSIILTDGKGQHESFRFTGNVLPHNAYGIVGTGAAFGLGTLQRDFPGAMVTGNVMSGGNAGRYPELNEFPETLPPLQRPESKDPAAVTPSEAAGVNLTQLCAALDVANPSPTKELAFCRHGD